MTSDNSGGDSAAACQNGNHPQVNACACCTALALVRMPQFAELTMHRASYSPAQMPNQNGTSGPRPISNYENAVGKHTPTGEKRQLGSTFAKLLSQGLNANRSKASATSKPTEGESAEGWSEDLSVPKPRRVWHGADGALVCIFGLTLPLLGLLSALAAMTKRISLIVLNHPIETLSELSLLLTFPLITFFVWSSIVKSNIRLPRLTSLLVGISCGAASLVAAVGFAMTICDKAPAALSEECNSLSFICIIGVAMAAISLYLIKRLHDSRDFIGSKKQIITYASLGVLASIFVFCAAEANQWFVRMLEANASNPKSPEAKQSLALLTQMNPERNLRMECADPRATGLCGFFLPIAGNAQRQLYFRLTGQPYSNHDTNNADLTAVSDEYIRNNIVGDTIKGLSLTRSMLTGSIHPRTMSGSLQWTFVFKNETSEPHEAVAEVALPPGAVISGLSVWDKGERKDGKFMPYGNVPSITTWNEAGTDDPGLVRDLGHGRVLVHAYPVGAEQELELRVNMITPLKRDGNMDEFTLPQFLASNFDLAGDHVIDIKGPSAFRSTATALASGSIGADKKISGKLTGDDLKHGGITVKATSQDASKPIFIFDKITTNAAVKKEVARVANLKQQQQIDRQNWKDDDAQLLQNAHDWLSKSEVEALLNKWRKATARIAANPVPNHFVAETISRVSESAPNRLAVVVDTSSTTKSYAHEIKAALEKIPSGIDTKIVFASEDEQAQPMPLTTGLKMFDSLPFSGGHNNLHAVITGADFAGQLKHGAVLWIHGPQPLDNHQIFISPEYAERPEFFEMSLGSETLDTVKYFENHPQIGPFTPVSANSKTADKDLVAFFDRWHAGNGAYAVNLAETITPPTEMETLSDQEKQEVLTLHAKQECASQLQIKHATDACETALGYGFVSPVSAVSCKLANSEATNDSAALQGATNGTIGPQGTDATVVSGVNTAGTVRVNNLANLEAMLNILANLSELAFLGIGFILLMNAFLKPELAVKLGSEVFSLSKGSRIAIAVLLGLTGLAIPGILNFLVASARDANLFS